MKNNKSTTTTVAAPVSSLVSIRSNAAQKVAYRSTVSEKAEVIGNELTNLYTSRREIGIKITGKVIEQITECGTTVLNYLSTCTENTCFAIRMPMKKETGLQFEKNVTIAQATKMTQHLFDVLTATGDSMAKTGCDLMVDAIVNGELLGLSHGQKLAQANAYFLARAARANRAEAVRELKVSSENNVVADAGMADDYAKLGATKSALAAVAKLQAAQAKLNHKTMDAQLALELARIA